MKQIGLVGDERNISVCDYSIMQCKPRQRVREATGFFNGALPPRPGKPARFSVYQGRIQSTRPHASLQACTHTHLKAHSICCLSSDWPTSSVSDSASWPAVWALNLTKSLCLSQSLETPPLNGHLFYPACTHTHARAHKQLLYTHYRKEAPNTIIGVLKLQGNYPIHFDHDETIHK